MRCGNLRDPVNGQVSVTGNGIGDEAVYSCNRGFVLFGDSKRVCTSNGAWSGSEPTCRRKEREREREKEKERE